MSEILEFYSKALRAMFGLAISRTIQQIKAAGHRFTYRQTINPKAVVVIGGSYAGTYLAQRLSETLPSGYKAVLIERNSHFNHLFVFPRFGIIPGREHMAFIPYDGLSSWGPPGIFQHIRDSVTGITSNQVQLASGKLLDFAYLALATGTWQPPPSKASSTEKSEACTELRFSQNAIHNASRIAIVGGGPVGVQIAADIASFFPNKDVTLVHSRQQLLPNFGPKLHKHVLQSLDRLKVNVILGDRPQLVPKDPADAKPPKLSFKGGHVVDYDLVIQCTGQKANSGLLENFAPAAICPTTKHILVSHTMQIEDSSMLSPHIFALGDVAKTLGPRMARAARAQADVVTSNILAMINKQNPTAIYRPQIYEGAIKLTLGKHNYAWYSQDNTGKEVLMAGTQKNEDLNVSNAWANLGSHFKPSLN